MFDKRLLSLLGKDKKYIFFIVICNLLTTISNIVITFSVCMIIDKLLGMDLLDMTRGMGRFLPYFAVAAIAVICRFCLSVLSGHFAAMLGVNAKAMLRRRIYEKTARLGVRETDDLSLASLTQVGIEGIEQLDLYYATYVPQLFYSMMSPLILFILLMGICPPSAIILLCCVPLIPMSIIAVSRYAKKIFAKYWGQYTKMGDAFLDNISGMKELKIFSADAAYHEKMNGEAEEFRKITMKVLTMQLASTTIMDLVAYGGAGLGIAIASWRHMSIHPLFDMSSPALLLFIVLTAVDFFLPLRALGSAFHVSMNGATAGKKILALLDTPEPVWGNASVCDDEAASGKPSARGDGAASGKSSARSDEPASGKISTRGDEAASGKISAQGGKSASGKPSAPSSKSASGKPSSDCFSISMEHVSFSYQPERKILDDISLKAAPGTFTAIVGLSGSGKSTIISLLSGIRPYSEGHIYVGSKELTSLSRDDYYKHMGVIAYDTYLFNDTVRENFRMASPQITDIEIMERLKAVRLEDIVTPDLVLSEGSTNLSGGQRQRLALAVGLSSDKEIYFFDEVTSNIDAESEAVIVENIRNLSRTKTVIMVSHRLKNFVGCGSIYVLDHGHIAEHGSHEELMLANGLYHEMFTNQQNMEEGYKNGRQ